MAAFESTAFEHALREVVRGDVSFDLTTRGLYATDGSIYQIIPAAVVLPCDEQDVADAVRVAAEHHVPIVPRGGGTSLGGQAVGPGMVIDFSKYMNRVLALDVDARWVRVQPGIVLDELNATLSPHGLHFAPDPATSSRATIGGMMGNNSSGTKSIIYGITRDHVLEVRALLADGALLNLSELAPDDYTRRAEGAHDNAREAEILRGFKAIIDANRDAIAARFPKMLRRVQGYNLDAFTETDAWNLSKLVVGSEGTLAVTLEAKLNLEPLPKCKVLCPIHFADLAEAIRTVSPILKHGPSAVEIMDAEVITRARKNLKIAPLCGFIQGDPKAVLIVEFFADTSDDAKAKARGLTADLEAQGLGYTWPILAEPGDQAKVWGVRKHGLGLMLGMTGDRKPLAFIEDAAVPVDVLPDYVGQVLAFCKARGVAVAMYAHASVGTIHIRPILNLKDQQDIDHMKAIADHAFELVTRYGGSWSGEHGDGRVRSPYLRRFFGDQVYEALRDVKRLFDPTGLMNPGPIIDPEPIDRHLRYGPDYKSCVPSTEYHYRESGGFAAAVEMCTGIGDCRQNLLETMCPSYRATRNEEDCTRGRANALRLAMTGQLGPDALGSRRLHDVLDLCLSCKACKSECPSNVDMARLKGEALQWYYDAHGASLRERLVGGSAKMASRLCGWPAPIVNSIQRSWPMRKLMQWLIGIDRRRRLPEYARTSLAQWFAQRPRTTDSSSKKVVLFDDTYMNYHELNVGVSAVELLESCGFEVVLANAGCCQRPRISHGFLRQAKQEGEQTLRRLDAFIEQGLPIVVCEPGCHSALTDDLPDLIDDEALGTRIKQHVQMIDVFLLAEIEAGRLDIAFTSHLRKVLIHGHCHQKSLGSTTAMQSLLQRVPGLSVTQLDSGCCGMAGSFGYEAEHYDLAMQIGEDRLFPQIREREDGVDVVACGFSCRHQIEDGTGVRAMHFVETLRGTAGPAR